MIFRCIRTYEVYFAAEERSSHDEDGTILAYPRRIWLNISKDIHIPFRSYHHQRNEGNRTLNGEL